MSSNFDYLRNFDNDLHYLACIIEDEIYTSPSAVLTDATTFLEIIVYEIFKKNELEMNDLVYFKDKIIFLSQAGFLTPELKKHMLKAYSIRNKMHSYNGDAKNHIHLNQVRAVHLHKLLFNVFQHFRHFIIPHFQAPIYRLFFAQPFSIHHNSLP